MAEQVGRELGAAYVLGGSLRRAGNRLRINTQLMDARTNFPLWSERYDRELQDVFEVQDEIARKIAEALRITLSPQEQAALATKPTENLQAYDLYLRGKSYARRLMRQDLEFALQMFENAVALDPNFAAAYAAVANVCAQHYYRHGHDPVWMERAKVAAERAATLNPHLPEAAVARAWVLYAADQHAEAVRVVRQAIEYKPDCEGAYFLLGRALFSSGRYQELVDVSEAAIAAAGEDYNVYVPIMNALGALGKKDALRNLMQRRIQALETHLRAVPEDARARTQLATGYARVDRIEDATREARFAIVLRPNEPTVLYNAACAFCMMNKKDDAIDTLRKAWEAGFRDTGWARRDPDLALLHDHPEFERLYPAEKT
jgi:tetratricopeptide (TPR) repeat protein